MTRDEFWNLIEEARRSVGSISDVPRWLEDRLSQLPEAEIVDFDSHFYDCRNRAYDARLWLAAVVILRGCGDDSFDDFRGWLIAQGREVFEAALEDPDSLAELKKFERDSVLEEMLYVGNGAYCKRVGKDRHDVEAIRQFEALQPHRVHPDLQHPELIRVSDDGALKLFPRLAARFPKPIYISPFT